MPKKSSFVDFKSVKAVLTMEQVLEHYGLLDKMKRSGDSLSGPCPIHKGSNPTQFRVSTSKNVWNCFSECKHGGNTLDFISRMENCSIHAAAQKAIEWFEIDPEAVAADRPKDEAQSDEAPAAKPQPVQKPAKESENGAPNKPLKFRLDKLDRSHPYLTKRDLTQETIIDFGVGFCAKGILADRIAIPIHNPAGEVVGYVGRFPGEPAEGTPKYKFPPGFKKSLELFNLDRAMKEPAEKPLVIVEGFFDCMKVHQNGYKKVVALMGSTMSLAQEELLKQHLTQDSRVVIMLDEDEAGRAGRDDVSARLSKVCFVKTHVFADPDSQPDQLTQEDLSEMLEGVQ